MSVHASFQLCHRLFWFMKKNIDDKMMAILGETVQQKSMTTTMDVNASQFRGGIWVD